MSGAILKSILYVEDDLYVRTTAKLVLEVLGNFTVRACRSGREALHAASDFPADLILLDVALPDIDGMSTLRMLRRFPHLAETPALFVTGTTSSREMAHFLEAGAIGILPKPLVPLRLTEQLISMWERRGQYPVVRQLAAA